MYSIFLRQKKGLMENGVEILFKKEYIALSFAKSV
jgi:hypothetical protein